MISFGTESQGVALDNEYVRIRSTYYVLPMSTYVVRRAVGGCYFLYG